MAYLLAGKILKDTAASAASNPGRPAPVGPKGKGPTGKGASTATLDVDDLLDARLKNLFPDGKADRHELRNLAADPAHATKLGEIKELLAREKKAAKDDDQFADNLPTSSADDPDQKPRRPAARAP